VETAKTQPKIGQATLEKECLRIIEGLIRKHPVLRADFNGSAHVDEIMDLATELIREARKSEAIRFAAIYYDFGRSNERNA